MKPAKLIAAQGLRLLCWLLDFRRQPARKARFPWVSSHHRPIPRADNHIRDQAAPKPPVWTHLRGS